MSMVIIKLSIQPLLENAILHGIHSSRRQGMITVAGAAEADRMTVMVSDNGVGMDEELVGMAYNPQ